jgi:site-specific DNA-methyltransferase (adenine-specific)
MYSFVNDIVLDPFVGTGTTMLAAIKSGRNSIGYEVDPKYVRVAKERLLDESSKLFGRIKIEVSASRAATAPS